MLRNKSTEEARKQREKEGRKELAKDSPPTGSEHAESSATLCCTYYKKPSVDSQEIENMPPQPESEGTVGAEFSAAFALPFVTAGMYAEEAMFSRRLRALEHTT